MRLWLAGWLAHAHFNASGAVLDCATTHTHTVDSPAHNSRTCPAEGIRQTALMTKENSPRGVEAEPVAHQGE
jgi:hypothetical protein